MHLLLTDRLCCPRCGPEFGLIALAQRVTERRLLEGSLGCPNCRERYPVHGGFADLRPPPRKPLRSPPPPGALADGRRDPAIAARIAALLGITEGPAYVLALGAAALHAATLGGLVPDLEVIAAEESLSAEEEVPGVSRIAAERSLPLRDRSVRGVVTSAPTASGPTASGPTAGAPTASGPAASLGFEEIARVLVPGGRLVLVADAGSDAASVPPAFTLLAREGEWAVLERSGGRTSTGVRLPVV